MVGSMPSPALTAWSGAGSAFIFSTVKTAPRIGRKNEGPPCLAGVGATHCRIGVHHPGLKRQAVQAKQARNFGPAEKSGEAGRPDERPGPAPLNAWRNAIAHHDIERHRADLNPHTVTIAACNTWHSAMNGLAESFDRVLADHLERLLGTRPW